jgi:hypothetical protein
MIKISSKKSKKILISTLKNQFLGICIIIIIIIIIYCTPTHAIITWWKWLPNVQPTTTFRCNKYDMKLPYVYACCCRVLLLSGGYNDTCIPLQTFCALCTTSHGKKYRGRLL